MPQNPRNTARGEPEQFRPSIHEGRVVPLSVDDSARKPCPSLALPSGVVVVSLLDLEGLVGEFVSHHDDTM